MKAKKTDPKSIRFNKKDLEIAMAKGNFESPQELVDCLLSNYVREDMEVISNKNTFENRINEQIGLLRKIKEFGLTI